MRRPYNPIDVLPLAALLYGCYKIVWYTVKMLKFARFAKELAKKELPLNNSVELLVLYFKKGLPDFIVNHEDKKTRFQFHHLCQHTVAGILKKLAHAFLSKIGEQVKFSIKKA